jgi:hypothetical protein
MGLELGRDMRVHGCLLAGAVTLLAAAPVFAQQTFFSTATADTFVAAQSSNANYGADDTLSISGAGQPHGEFQSLVRFNLASTVAFFNGQYGAGQWVIRDVLLELNGAPPNAIMDPNHAGFVDFIWQANDSWTEGTGTAGAPTMDGVTFATLPLFQGPADQPLGTLPYDGDFSEYFYGLDLPPEFIADILSGGDVSFRLAPASNNLSFNFFAREAGVFNGPSLFVTAEPIPEPGTGTLLAIGCGAAVIVTNKRVRRASVG